MNRILTALQTEATKLQTRYYNKVKKNRKLKSKVKTLEKTVKDYQELVRRMRKDAKELRKNVKAMRKDAKTNRVTVREEDSSEVQYVEQIKEEDDIIELLEKEGKKGFLKKH